jgi:type IV pilus assembly protein PilN
MRISVNLATRPFVELRPYFLRLRYMMGALAVVAVALIVTAHILQVRLDAAQARMNELHDRTERAGAEKQSNERRMRQPANAAVLNRAHFLNTLFLRKSFSWTAVMMDLETVLPSGVQVTSIEPQIGNSGDVVIRMRVSGDRDRAVQLVRNLERSKRFLQPRLNSESVQAKDIAQNAAAAQNGGAVNGAPAGVEFEILANYNPLPEGEAYPKAKPAANATNPATKTTNATASPRITGGKLPGVVLKPFSHPPVKGGAR